MSPIGRNEFVSPQGGPGRIIDTGAISDRRVDPGNRALDIGLGDIVSGCWMLVGKMGIPPYEANFHPAQICNHCAPCGFAPGRFANWEKIGIAPDLGMEPRQSDAEPGGIHLYLLEQFLQLRCHPI